MTPDESLARTAEALGIEGFSDDPVQRVVDFAEALPAIHGAAASSGDRIQLEPWELRAIESIYGVRQEDGRRRYRTAYIEIPRKNGKSTFCAILALYSLLIEQEPNAEIYSIAYTMKQAKIVFDTAAKMLERLPDDFVAFERVYSNQEKPIVRVVNPPQYGIMHHYPSGGKYEVLAANSASSYGYNPSMVIFDELHVQKTRALWDTMRTSFGARREPLLVAITTAGNDKTSICYKVREHAVKVSTGEEDHPTFLPIIYAADAEDDWQDREVWKKANPSLGTLKTWESMEEEFREAEAMPSSQNAFKREHLNIWTAQETAWIPREKWDACAKDFTLDEFEGEPCWGGLDMASKHDLCAHVQVFKRGDAHWWWAHFWMPEGAVDEKTRTEGIPYREWVDKGLITATPGEATDFATVLADIKALSRRFRYQQVGADDFQAEYVMQQLDGAGVPMVKVPQTYGGMNEPAQEVEARIKSKRIAHPGNAVLDHHFSNVQVYTDGPTGRIRPVRPKHDRRLKIDGVVAGIMAERCAMLHQDKTSMYADPEFEPVYVELG